MLGYLVVGVLIGPQRAGAGAATRQASRHLAEFGVVFLMFVIGLEFNLPKLRSMRTLVFGLGLSPGGADDRRRRCSATRCWPGRFARAGRGWGLGWQSAVALGGALAMSSTAIVVKLMAERLELETEHGRRVMGVLLFQDLAVVPLLVLIPALGAPPEALLARAGASRCAQGGALLTRAAGRRPARDALVADAGGAAQERRAVRAQPAAGHAGPGLAHRAWPGLSLALGAFVAGMLIAETEYKHQVETDIRPFHDVLLGLFFITIGMMLDWRPVLEHWAAGAAADDVLPVLFKFGLVDGAGARCSAPPPGVALRTGLYLAQAGEFGFVLLTLAHRAAAAAGRAA